MGVEEALAHARVAVNTSTRNVQRGVPVNATALVRNHLGSFYLRAGQRAVGFQDSYVITLTVELATIAIFPKYQRCGICTRVLDGLEALAREHNRWVYVENVLNEDLDQFLRLRRLYTPIHNLPPGYESFAFNPKARLVLDHE